MSVNHFLAFDLGASSGRAILGSLSKEKITLKEVHRFPNNMLFEANHYYWDIQALLAEIKTGLRRCVDRFNTTPSCIGIDTWGVDFGLLNSAGDLAGNPFAYRDHLTDTAMQEVFTKITAEDLYAETGIQFMQFNSLFQLWALKKKYPEKLLSADKLLFMPDLLSYFLTGSLYSEYTIASTSQMLDPKTGGWNMRLLQKLGLPTHILEEIVEPGTLIGHVLPEIQAEFGIGPVQVAAVGAHDTASATAAIPASGEDWAFISSGTWSLLGVELQEPCLSQDSFKAAFTNEGGVDGKTRYLKNITGLWLLQECKKKWDRNREYSFAELAKMSLKAPAFKCFIDPDDPVFLNPENMVEAIQNYCERTQQVVPQTIPEISRCIFESLALKYKFTFDQLQSVTQKEVNRIHLIGGGSQNMVLSQFTSNALGLEVIAGPAESTALGNILLQAKALGVISSIEVMRNIVKLSIETRSLLPQNENKWRKAFLRYKELISNSLFE